MKRSAYFFGTIAVLGLLLILNGVSAVQNGPVTITMWHSITESDPFHPVLQGAIDQFNATHGDVQFELQNIPSDIYQDRLRIAMMSGQAPDVFQTWGGRLLASFVDAGLVRDIPQLDTRASFLSNALAPSTFDGRHYAVPANIAGVFLWYNQDLFTQHNVQPPATWQQFIAACQSFRTAGIVPVALGNQQQWPGAFWYTYLVMRLGGSTSFGDAFNDAADAPMDDAFVEAGRFLQDAVKAGCFEENFSAVGLGDAQRMFGTGVAAMQLQGDWNLGGLYEVGTDLTNLQILPFPVVEGGRGASSDMIGGTGQAFAISVDAPLQANTALIELFGSEAFGQAMAQAGFIPALVGHESSIEDPVLREMSTALANASYVQLFSDQYLAPALAQVHLETVQRLLEETVTPEEGMEIMADAERNEFVAQLVPEMTLRELAEVRGIEIGAAVNVDVLRQEPHYGEVLRREFNMLTPELAMKMEVLRPSQDTFNFDDADYLLNFAEANDMAVRGHPLVWYRQLPSWLENGSFTREELLEILHEHINTVVGRYRDRIDVWDVVNEAIDEDGSLRDSIWLRTIGPEYIDYAFQWAHEADPDAQLFYNDYDAEGLGPKSDAGYDLVAGLVDRGVPVDGVGFQMHTSIGNPPPMSDVAANMERLADLGLVIQITEMDVKIQDGTGSEAERFIVQAQVYRDMTGVCLDSPACTSITTWGFTDQYSWIPASTGQADAPLIFDTSYQPKPAYYALLLALSDAVQVHR